MFENQVGLWALLSLIPFIILYLIKPKPEDKVIPSLMFLVKNQKKSNKYSFLRKFIVNLLFFIQLLAIILLSLSVAAPFVRMPYDVTMENTVLVIDSSASMQAGDKETRFEKAIKKAKNLLSGKNSIILAEQIPLIALEDESINTALDALNKLKPKATTTNLGDAMLLAKDILGDRSGRIVLLSDFASVDGPDLEVVKKTLMSDEVAVDFIDVSDETGNIGIVKFDLLKHNMKIYVKNYKDTEEEITLKLMKGNEKIAESGKIKITSGSIETFVFDEVPGGLSYIELTPKDNFQVDNKAYISTPDKKYINVLLITNEINSNLELALKASRDVNLNVIDLYKSPALNFNTNNQNIKPYDNDIIILHKMNKPGERGGMLLSGFTDLANFAKKGGKLIITANENTESVGMDNLFGKLNFIDIKKRVDKPAKACIEIVNEFTKHLENERCFTSTGKYYEIETKEGAVNIASINENPGIVYKTAEKGKVLYYGIMDDLAEFKSLPSYPIFWNNLINFMQGSVGLNEFNYNTGKIAAIEEQEVKTPSGKVKTSKILMDEVGYYEFKDRTVAVNLFSEDESDISLSPELESSAKESNNVLEKERAEHNFNIAPLLLILVLILLIIETIYIKVRGDL